VGEILSFFTIESISEVLTGLGIIHSLFIKMFFEY